MADPETPKQLVARMWNPHLGALHTKITAADYDGIFGMVSRISLDIAIAAALSAARQPEVKP